MKFPVLSVIATDDASMMFPPMSLRVTAELVAPAELGEPLRLRIDKLDTYEDPAEFAEAPCRRRARAVDTPNEANAERRSRRL